MFKSTKNLVKAFFLLLLSCFSVLLYLRSASMDSQSSRAPREASGAFIGPPKTPFSLREIVEKDFKISRWNASWFSGSSVTFRDSSTGSLVLHDVLSGSSRVLVPGSIMIGRPRVHKAVLSPDEAYVLLSFQPQKIFRHSFLATYEIYEVSTGARASLAPPSEGLPEGLKPLTVAVWGHFGSSIAYVFANDIYYRPSAFGRDLRVTDSGLPGVIFNGISDWVYEEEVLSASKALWFSPDDKHLAWIQFNDTAVDSMPLDLYGPPGSLDFQYPFSSPIKYPKPGRSNPTVNVFAARLSGNGSSGLRKMLLEPPQYFQDKERLIYALTWANDFEVSLTWENRVQNYSIVSICNVEQGGECSDALVMEEPSGWMELGEAPLFSQGGRVFALALSSEGYTHVNVINRDTNQRIPLTSGRFVVTEISHWDEVSSRIYFLATRPDYPGERHLYSVSDFTATLPGLVECISCNLANTAGGRCGYNSFEFSRDNSLYVVSCGGPYVPQDYLFRKDPNTLLEVLERNEYLSDQLSLKLLPKVSNLDIPIGEDGSQKAKVRLYLPHDFSEESVYPLLVNVYAGPNSQQVSDRFKLDWGTHLSTERGVIYALIDGRGSGYQGNEVLFGLHRALGTLEVQDQLTVMEVLLRTYSFIDKDRVAIWGWSYGGFVSTSVLALDAEKNNVFKCGIAVAPVTNWIYYDTIYAERYMGLPTPEDNLRAYQASDLSAKARAFKNKKLLIVHGTADDNVHYQQSMMLVRSLEQENVLFSQISYPDETHSLAGIRPHFFQSLSHFLLNDCFGRNVTNIYK